jgi:hypothetical protein
MIVSWARYLAVLQVSPCKCVNHRYALCRVAKCVTLLVNTSPLICPFMPTPVPSNEFTEGSTEGGQTVRRSGRLLKVRIHPIRPRPTSRASAIQRRLIPGRKADSAAGIVRHLLHTVTWTDPCLHFSSGPAPGPQTMRNARSDCQRRLTVSSSKLMDSAETQVA